MSGRFLTPPIVSVQEPDLYDVARKVPFPMYTLSSRSDHKPLIYNAVNVAHFC